LEIDQKIIENFSRDGAVVLRSAFAPEWIDKLRTGLKYNIDTPGPYTRSYTGDGGVGHFFGDYCNWQRIDEYKDFVKNSPISIYARTLMGTKQANFFHEHVVVKEPGTLEPTPWHHDQPYYCVDGDDSVSLWMPLDPVPKQWGVEFIAGSHKWDRWFRPKKFVGQDYDQDDDGFEAMPDIEADRDQHKIVSFDLEPGDCVAFHFRTVHGAPGNGLETTRRRAIAWRWVGDDARYVLRKGVMSPPFPDMENCRLSVGDKLDSDLFPAFLE
jgi:ectoine hydroxylase-related dioxygenase (phytanoyl-CoA dioxygenase family)